MGNNIAKISINQTNTYEQTVEILNQINTFDLSEYKTININGQTLKNILRAYYELESRHGDIVDQLKHWQNKSLG